MIICLSGACHSGKTSFSKAIKRELGDRVVLYDEIIRNKAIKDDISNRTIDELRKDPKLYLSVQKRIIVQKSNEELKVKSSKEYNDKLVIFDRSLIDSLYYYIMFMNKEHGESEFDREYFIFLEQIITRIKYCCDYVYDYICIMKPIKNLNTKHLYRPKLLNIIQNSEYEIIKALTYGFCKNVREIDEREVKGFLQDINYF